MKAPIVWPDGKSFAFTVFDDPDFQTPQKAGAVYDLLTDLGFRTTKGIWPTAASQERRDYWGTCSDPQYLTWARNLQERGFELGWHGARPLTSTREQTAAGLERFRELFGQAPLTGSQHYDCEEGLYWGDQRLSGRWCRFLYNVFTRGANRNHFHGHVPGHPNYWSDLCKKNIKYMRNFVFAEINTLAACPFMPYHDPLRPDVNFWYASSEGHDVRSFTATLSEVNQDRLEQEGGACIMYTHFAYGFAEGQVLDSRFRVLMQRLSQRNGWFVPVGTLLDYIAGVRGATTLSSAERRSLERRWLFHKVRFGSA